jgi:uncharacterized protein (TIGR02147 family)
MQQKRFRDLLKNHYAKLKSRNPNFSLRSYAKKLQISSGALTEVFKGTRQISPTLARKLVARLALEPSELSEFENTIANTEGTRQLVPEAAHELVSDWRYFAILCLFELDKPIKTVGQASRRLGLSEDEVQDCFDYLVAHGILNLVGDSYVHAGLQWATHDNVPSTGLRKVHREGFSQASRALETVEIDQRDVFALTFAGGAEQMKIAKQEIRAFCDRLERLMTRGEVDTVYKVAVQLFPIDERISPND